MLSQWRRPSEPHRAQRPGSVGLAAVPQRPDLLGRGWRPLRPGFERDVHQATAARGRDPCDEFALDGGLDGAAGRVEAYQPGVSEVLLPRVQGRLEGSARGAAEHPHPRFGEIRLPVQDVRQVPAAAPWFALCTEQPVARGERRALRIVVRVVRGLARLDRDVAQRQVTRARAVAEDAYVLQEPLLDLCALLVEDLQGERADGRRAVLTRAREDLAQLPLGGAADQFVRPARGRLRIAEEVLGLRAQGPDLVDLVLGAVRREGVLRGLHLRSRPTSGTRRTAGPYVRFRAPGGTARPGSA
ncbi:hypothetical protein ACRJ4W_32930 [Streptomyces sp. GLT-R25]